MKNANRDIIFQPSEEYIPPTSLKFELPEELVAYRQLLLTYQDPADFLDSIDILKAKDDDFTQTPENFVSSMISIANQRQNSGQESPKKIVGKLINACSDKEMVQKQQTATCHSLEQLPRTFTEGKNVPQSVRLVNKHLAVKAFQRSDASKSFTAEDSRALLTCRETIHQILFLQLNADVLSFPWIRKLPSGYSFIDVYNFLRDRIRALWQDITVQHASCHKFSVECLEISFRILLLAEYLLCQDPTFENKQHMRLMDTCFDKLMHGYDEARQQSQYQGSNQSVQTMMGALVYFSPNEAEFRAYKILGSLGSCFSSNSANFLDVLSKVPHELRNNKHIKFALSVHKSVREDNIRRYFRLLSKAPFLTSVLMNRFANTLRVRQLTTIFKFGIVKRSSLIPVVSFGNIFGISYTSDREAFLEFLEKFSLEIKDLGRVLCVDLKNCSVETFDDIKAGKILPWKVAVISDKCPHDAIERLKILDNSLPKRMLDIFKSYSSGNNMEGFEEFNPLTETKISLPPLSATEKTDPLAINFAWDGGSAIKSTASDIPSIFDSAFFDPSLDSAFSSLRRQKEKTETTRSTKISPARISQTSVLSQALNGSLPSFLSTQDTNHPSIASEDSIPLSFHLPAEDRLPVTQSSSESFPGIFSTHEMGDEDVPIPKRRVSELMFEVPDDLKVSEKGRGKRKVSQHTTPKSPSKKRIHLDSQNSSPAVSDDEGTQEKSGVSVPCEEADEIGHLCIAVKWRRLNISLDGIKERRMVLESFSKSILSRYEGSFSDTRAWHVHFLTSPRPAEYSAWQGALWTVFGTTEDGISSDDCRGPESSFGLTGQQELRIDLNIHMIENNSDFYCKDNLCDLFVSVPFLVSTDDSGEIILREFCVLPANIDGSGTFWIMCFTDKNSNKITEDMIRRAVYRKYPSIKSEFDPFVSVIGTYTKTGLATEIDVQGEQIQESMRLLFQFAARCKPSRKPKLFYRPQATTVLPILLLDRWKLHVENLDKSSLMPSRRELIELLNPALARLSEEFEIIIFRMNSLTKELDNFTPVSDIRNTFLRAKLNLQQQLENLEFQAEWDLGKSVEVQFNATRRRILNIVHEVFDQPDMLSFCELPSVLARGKNLLLIKCMLSRIICYILTYHINREACLVLSYAITYQT
eukprot:GHVP01014867.1.p1 GENE.GHVP01014867.1~~GHVP01014867.1.p1  ORF type:complete len:1151 (+),score=176.15 GHVP01014867.1:2623-6075(+)